jgi:hypothetical protein
LEFARPDKIIPRKIMSTINGKYLGTMALLATAASVTAAVPTLETFDSDTAGFGPNTTSSVVVHVGAGGNPGGFIQTRKDLTPPVFDVGALTLTPNFTGDYASAGIGSFSVDLNFFTDNITDAWVRVRPSIVENGWLFPLTSTFPTDEWNTYGVAFDPSWTDAEAALAGWVTDQDINPIADPSPSFASVMSSVNSLEVRIASPVESTLVGIDNVRIDAAGVPDSSSLLVEAMVVGALAFGARRLRKPVAA